MNILYIVKSLSVVEPLGVMQISAITRAQGHRSLLGVIDHGDPLAALEREEIHLVAYSMLSTEARAFHTLTTELRRRHPRLPIVAGGPHPTYFPSLVDEWPINAVVVGEGDEAIRGITDTLERSSTDFSHLDGVHTPTTKNPVRPLVASLDQLPFPDRELVHHHIPLRYTPMKSFMATRGCPYSCSYCFNNAYKELYRGKGKMVRRRSVANLIQEIEAVRARYPLQFVRFGDDVFVTGEGHWLEEFREQYRRRIGLPFYCLIRPNLVKEPVVRALKEAGCHSVAMSLESGNETLRREVLNRPIDQETMTRAYRLMRDYDIKIFSNAMLGLPGSTLQDDLETLEMTFRLQPTYASFTIFTPFPGTDLYKMCLDQGEIEGRFEGGNYPESTFQDSVLKSVDQERQQLHRNILLLGALANWLPWLQGWARRRLHRAAGGWLGLVGFVVRNYLQRRIWPFRAGMINFVRLVWNVYRIDRRNYASRTAGADKARESALAAPE